MNESIKQIIAEKIEAYDKIILCRHKRPDGDAFGSTKGLQAILKQTYPEKQVFLLSTDSSSLEDYLGAEDAPLTAAAYTDALVIVLDCATADRIANEHYTLAREVIRIDHHLSEAPYGDLVWVEENRSSTCEMIADLYRTYADKWKMDTYAATCLYLGMVTDSGRFRYPETGEDTMLLAGMLLRFGLDTERMYARLYLDDVSFLRFKAWGYRKMKVTEHGVAYLHLTRAEQEKFGLSNESASACVSFMEGIRGVLMWMAFIENEDGSTRVRLRSRFLPCRPLALSYRGGGHDNASGATVYNAREMRNLIKEADAAVAAYKAEHDGWL